MDLDRTDVEILRLLQEDARRSFRDLGRRIGVSVPTVSARVANLEHLGILAGYHAAIDPESLRQTRVVVILRCRPGAEDAVGRALAKLPEVRWTIRTEGSRVVAEVVLPASTKIDGFLKRVTSLEDVWSCEHHVATERFKDAPRARISGTLSAKVACFECDRRIEGVPVKIRLDGRNHYFCCGTCETLYRQRYRKIEAAAGLRRTDRTRSRISPP